MPTETSILVVLIAIAVLVGILLGWLLRHSRARREKVSINDGWLAQIASQKTEHERLLEQNKTLMQQNSQYQASNRDAKNRATELSESVQEAFKRRDALQRDIKDIRSNLETALSERDQLRTSAATSTDLQDQLTDKQTEIARLRSDLAGWQSRVPPLIESFRKRNADAERLDEELLAANERIALLEKELEFARREFVERQHDQTYIEPVSDPGALTDGRDASNDPLDSIDGSLPGGGGLRDALQKIKGVGPAIEKTLNDMGIFRFQQIADLSEYDIARVADRLKGFRSRIYREDWIGQARELCNPQNHG